jgi:hypothetical protein
MGGSTHRRLAKEWVTQPTQPPPGRSLMSVGGLGSGTTIGRQSWTGRPTWKGADTGGQAVIIAEHATRWYLAHLLLFIGLVLFVPGLLTLTNLAAASSPRVGYTARVLTVIGIGGTAAIFVAELLAGRLGSVGAAATEDFLATMFSGPIAGPLIPVALAFFVGAAVFAVPFIAGSGPLRWPAVVLLAGVLLVLAEIISSQVLLSQIGNLLIWIGGLAFARLVVRGEAGAQAQARPGQALSVG